jgi:hypothetical protein
VKKETALAWLLLAAGVAAAVLLGRLPGMEEGETPESEFSARRAFGHVEKIAVAPHPVGTEEHERVRDYVVETLSEAGYVPELQRSEDPIPLTNVLARLPGVESTGTVCVVSHYDTKPAAPGAGGDGSSVGAMLEAARYLKNSEPLRNDVLFLFTDGEEVDLLGARAFVREHPAFADVALVLNFEARGSAGRSLMFQTGLPNEWLVRQFEIACSRPASNSLMAAVYRRMPNDTDFTIFDRAGIPGLNFAFIEGYTTYHTAEDIPENLDPATMAHHARNLIEVVTRFGDTDLRVPLGDRVVYFDVLGRWLVVYDENLVWPLAAILALLWLALVRTGVRRHVMTVGGVAAGFGGLLLGVALTALFAWGLAKILLGIHEGDIAGPVRGTHSDHLYSLVFLAGALAVFWFVVGSFVRRYGATSVHAGALLLWLALALLTAAVIPAGSFLFAWPLLFALIGLAWLLPLAAEGRLEKWIPLATAAFGLPAVLMLWQFVIEFQAALALGGAIVPWTLAALTLGLFLPLKARV